jgi:Flp pilus assembly protein TadG
MTRRVRSESGASALEMSFIAPGLLLLIFFCIQGALFFYGRSVALQAAREGVSQLRLAQDQATYDDISPDVVSNIETYAVTVGRESLLEPHASSSYDDAAGRVQMTVTGDVITLVPGLHLSVTQSAEGPVERFEGDTAP